MPESAGSAPTSPSNKSDTLAKPRPSRPSFAPPPPPMDRTSAFLIAAIAGLACTAVGLLFVNLPFALIAGLLVVVIVLLWKMRPA